jgi:hypothetical protein
MIKRTINIDVTITIECCRDGVSAYVPEPQSFHKTLTVTKDKFKDDITDWRNKIIEYYEAEKRERAEKECLMVGTRRLCIFKADWTNTTVDEELIAPEPFTPIELARAKQMIKDLEEAAERLPWAREDLLKRANELREKYGLVGVQL